MREETLGTYPYPFIEVACRYCARRGRYRRERLIREHGAGMSLGAFVAMVSADCGYAQVRTGRRRCSGPYIVPPDVRAPIVPKTCMLMKERNPFGS